MLFVRSLASDKELYKFFGVKDMINKDQEVSGQIINYGTNEVNVPQVIHAQYDQDKNIYWVEQEFLERGIRPQRKKPFSVKLMDINQIKAIKTIDQIYVNGTPNIEMKIDRMANKDSDFINWKKTKDGFVEIKLNGFVYELNK